MSQPSENVGFITCPGCEGECYWIAQDGVAERCPDCEGQGEICVGCGAPPRYQVGDEWGGGCWCHY